MDEKEILEGFNAGYILEQYRPKLAKELIEGVKDNNSPFVEGFVAGSQAFAKEKGKSKFLAKLRSAQKSSKSTFKARSKPNIDREI